MINRAERTTMLLAGEICLYTDQGVMTICAGRKETENDAASIQADIFDKGGDVVYRIVRLKCRKNLTLYRLEYLLEVPAEYGQFIEYKTFIEAPAAAFVRYGEESLFTGVENPFFSARMDGQRLCLSYEPSLILQAGECYEAEPQFLGGCRLSGQWLREWEPVNIEALQEGIRRPRFFNPCGEIALDSGEIEAMREYVAEYYDVIEKRFDHILYYFFYPQKPFPETEEEVNTYLASIDRFSRMQGDIIAFNPHVKTVIPDADRPYWELAPENSAAERILRYAQGKGLRCGYYMGCAFNGSGGNAALLPYRPDRPEWKKLDDAGHRGQENCLGCDEYLEWYYEVQKNTIRKYQLGYWAWDPGPGNGNDCYAVDHGHIPGKGEYKGWRNSQKLLARLKAEFPKLFLMSFYGRKEYGIWGFRYFSQHEIYWEQTVLFGATLHNDLHDDRINAHGTRLQNQWCMNFRFLPAYLGHGLVPRMGESYFDPMMDRAYDLGGWKYALISAIACCGSVTQCTLPDRLENVPGFQAFYEKWIRWAREKYRYCAYTRPVADRVSNEVIDGFSRIDGDSGQIFLFNSSPRILRKRLPLDGNLGLDTEKEFYLRILYCEGAEAETEGMQYGGGYHMGDLLDITLPPYGAVVLEMDSVAGKNIGQLPDRSGTIDGFVDDEGMEFEYPRHAARESVALTTRVMFKRTLRDALAKMHTEHEALLQEKIPLWQREGIPFTFVSALPQRLALYVPFDGAIQPRSMRLFINGKDVQTENFQLREIPVLRYAYIEEWIQWDRENEIRLEIEGLAANSFMGLYVDHEADCDGICAKTRVWEEYPEPSKLHADDTLIIDSLTVTPDTFTDEDGIFTVSVRTAVPPEKIERVYIVHPTVAQMPSLTYDKDTDTWVGRYHTGVRAYNIFCSHHITARIRGRDGGVGPAKQREIRMRYTQK